MSLDAFLENAQITGLLKGDLRVTGGSSVGDLVKAAYRLGSGNVMFTRAPLAGGPAVDFGVAVASGSTYAIQQSDRGYRISARPVSYLPGNADGIGVPLVGPLAPTITAITPGNGSLTVTFTRNADNGGAAVTTDQVNVYSATTKAIIAQATGASPLPVPGVPNGVPVIVKAGSINSVGLGTLSASSTVVTAGILPAPTTFETFDADVGFTYNAASTHQVVGGAIEITGNGSPATLTLIKRAFASIVPASVGVITVEVNKKSNSNIGYGLSVTSGATPANAQIITDSPTKYASGRRIMSMHISEFPTIAGLGAGTMDIGCRVTQAAPNDGKAAFDDGRINSMGFATFILRYDDGYPSQYSFAAPDLESHGFRGSFFLAKDRVGIANSLSLDQYRDLYARGHEINCDSTTNDTAAVIAGFSDAQLAALFLDGYTDGVTKGGGINANRQFLLDSGLATRGDGAENILCWANGTWSPVLVNAARDAGYTLGFTTEPATVHTNRGFGDIALTLPAKSTSASSVTWAQLKQIIDLAILRGDTLVIYMHALLVNATTVNMSQALHTQMLDYLKVCTDAGQAAVLTAAQLKIRDWLRT